MNVDSMAAGRECIGLWGGVEGGGRLRAFSDKTNIGVVSKEGGDIKKQGHAQDMQ